LQVGVFVSRTDSPCARSISGSRRLEWCDITASLPAADPAADPAAHPAPDAAFSLLLKRDFTSWKIVGQQNEARIP